MIDATDFELVKAAQSGSSSAFEALLERHYGMMFKVAFKWCGQREDAEDIAQEVCMKLARVLPGFGFESSFTTWLYRVILNTGKDLMRQRATRMRHESEYVREADFSAPPPTQEDELIARQAWQKVWALPEKTRDAVVLVAGEGLSHADAAKVLRCAETTVSWRLFQARKEMKRMFG